MTKMSPSCLHALNSCEPLSSNGFGQAVEFTNGGKLRKADRSGLSLLGILCSIHLSYGGVILLEIIFVVS